MIERSKYAVDTTAVTVTGGTLLDALPDIAAAFSILWFILRLWESKTLTQWRRRWRRSKHEKDINCQD